MIIGTLNPVKPSATRITGPRIVTKAEMRAQIRERQKSAEHTYRQVEYLARQVEVIDICTLLDRMGITDEPCDVYMDMVVQWAKSADAYIYEMDRQHFSVWDARRQAVKRGKKKVIVHDLS